jgi:hypothetical protein
MPCNAEKNLDGASIGVKSRQYGLLQSKNAKEACDVGWEKVAAFAG